MILPGNQICPAQIKEFLSDGISECASSCLLLLLSTSHLLIPEDYSTRLVMKNAGGR